MERMRREPPSFRRVEVSRVARRSPRLARLTLSGSGLQGLDIGLPAASVRLLLPEPGVVDVTLPTWNGNEFLHADGSRAAIRTLTPLRFDVTQLELEVEVVLHGHGPLSSWAERARPGDRAAISGPGRGYEIDPAARRFLVAGDESALPAIGLLLESLPIDAQVDVLVEIADPVARVELPSHPGATVRWSELPEGARPGDALVAAAAAAPLDPDVRVWAAGEAAAVQRIRRHLFEEVGLPRSHAVVRGYWKHDRPG